MSSQSAPDKFDPSRFFVVVDPSDWTAGLDRLALTIRDAYAVTAPDQSPPGLAVLLEKLRAGAATVSDGWSRERSLELVAALKASGINAKLARRRRGRVSGALPAVVSSSAARPATSPRPPTPKAPTPKPPTIMTGWQRRSRPRAPAREPEPTVQDEPHAAGLGDDPHDAEPRMPVMGWTQVLEPGADGAARDEPPDDDPSDERDTVVELPSAHPESAESQAAPAPTPPVPPPPRLPLPPPPGPGRGRASAKDVSDGRAPVPPARGEAVGAQPAGATGTGSAADAAERDAQPGAESPVAPARPPLPDFGLLGADELPGRPVPSAELAPRPWLAGLLSALAPGAGQVYVGRRDSGVRYAMAAPLVLPWIDAVRDARHWAREIARGARPARKRPQLGRALVFAVTLWAVVATLAGTAVWAYHELTEPTAPSAGVAPDPLLPRQPTPSPDPPRDERSALAAEAEARQREARAARLTIRAHEACEESDFERCLALSDEARRLDGELHQAVRLFHRASLGLERRAASEGSGRTSPPENEPPSDEEPP